MSNSNNIISRSNNISALYCSSDSIYKNLLIDVYDSERNAFTFDSDNVVICHPPCRTWGRLSHMSSAPKDEYLTGIHAVNMVRKNGGILEHPAGSKLFKYMNIPVNGSYDKYNGFIISVNQHWFGHRAQKRTWLYIVGIKRNQLPALPINYDAITHVVGSSKKRKTKDKGLPEITRNERSATPLKLAKWLIEVANIIIQVKQHN